MMNNECLSGYVYLAETSYADFTGIENIIDVETKTNETIERIKKTYPKDPKPKEFAELITNNYTVEAHWKDRGTAFNSESGFSGTLFKGTGHNGGNNGYLLALKGTEGGKDLLAVDAGDIVNDGLVHHQIASAIH